VAQLVVPLEIIVETSCKQVEYLMGGGNAHTWHDLMCQGHTLVAN
jgi:hypothetical protein